MSSSYVQQLRDKDLHMDTEAMTTYLSQTKEAQQAHTTVSSPADC